MRILMLTDLRPELRAGGSERFVVELGRALARRGHQVAWTGARLRPGNWPPGLYHARVGTALRGALRRTLRGFRPDLIHAHHPLAARLAATTGLPLVRTVHGAWQEELRRRRPLLARVASLAPGWLVGDDDRARVAVGSAALQAAVPEAALIPPGVDCERFRPVERRAGDPPVIGTVCRLAAERGVERFVALAAALRDRARFRVAGSGPLERRLRGAARRLGAPIDWCGAVRDVPAFLGQLDLYVNPSSTESFGLALLEAMACGLPVVAAESPGARRLLAPGAGRLAEPAGLAEAVRRLLEDPAARDQLARGARRQATGFCWDRTAGLYEQLYQR